MPVVTRNQTKNMSKNLSIAHNAILDEEALNLEFLKYRMILLEEPSFYEKQAKLYRLQIDQLNEKKKLTSFVPSKHIDVYGTKIISIKNRYTKYDFQMNYEQIDFNMIKIILQTNSVFDKLHIYSGRILDMSVSIYLSPNTNGTVTITRTSTFIDYKQKHLS